MPRQNMKAIRRSEITQALYRCIVRVGYVNTSVRDIAREANMRSGLIHHYFDSKDEILSALMKDIFRRYQRSFALLSERHRNKPSEDRLRLGIEFIFVKVAGNKDLIRVFHELWNLSQHNETLHESLKVLYRLYRKEVARFITECMGQSHGETKEVKNLAAFIVSASEGASIQWLIDSRGISLSNLAKVSSRLIKMIIGLYEQGDCRGLSPGGGIS